LKPVVIVQNAVIVLNAPTALALKPVVSAQNAVTVQNVVTVQNAPTALALKHVVTVQNAAIVQPAMTAVAIASKAVAIATTVQKAPKIHCRQSTLV
jgi:hypothetical protein